MERLLTRRQILLGLPLGLLLVGRRAHALSDGRSVFGYQLDLSVLYSVLTLSVSGTAVLELDRRGGTYRVAMEGQGVGITTKSEASGILRDGRFKPVETRAVHHFRGRQNTSTTTYDYDRQRVEIHGVTHTLLLGRRRQVDDILTIPPGRHLDDLLSAELNFIDQKLDRDPDGTYHTWVIRRARPANEGPDDVSPDGYRAEMVPLRFRPSPDAATGRLTAQVDITRFSSWAHPARPARVTFAPDRQIESVQSFLQYGTTLSVRVTATA
jgi:hypothetical protein